MKRVLFFMLLGASAAVVGQQLWLQQDAPAEPASEQGAPEPGADSDEAGAEAGQDTADEGPDPASAPGPGGSADEGDADAEAAGAETEAGSADMEFEPDEEISEDYPVPLPSDI